MFPFFDSRDRPLYNNSPVTAALTDYDIPSLEARLGGDGFLPSHASRLLKALYRGNGTIDVESLTPGKRLLARLTSDLPPRSSQLIARHVSADGTTKLLVGFADGNAVETVLMPSHREGVAAGCVSSQVGCAMGCDFCASTRGGLVRNLTAGEIVEQFLHLRAAAASAGRRVKTLVFMGMGEPLANFDNVVGAIGRISDRRLGALGRRQITVSTVGLVPGIDKLAEADLNVHLAIAARARRRDARAARSAEPALPRRRHHGGRPALPRAQRARADDRVLHARGRERFGRAGGDARGTDGRLPRAREPDSVQRDRPGRQRRVLPPAGGNAHATLRRDPARARGRRPLPCDAWGRR